MAEEVRPSHHLNPPKHSAADEHDHEEEASDARGMVAKRKPARNECKCCRRVTGRKTPPRPAVREP